MELFVCISAMDASRKRHKNPNKQSFNDIQVLFIQYSYLN